MVSRGPGHIQRRVLDQLSEDPTHGVSVLDVAHWLSDVRYEWDTEPTRAQIESARRALNRLEQSGRLVSTTEAPAMGIGRPSKVYLLPS